MAAELGNQYWKLRSKHGRDRIIKDHKKLEEAADQYFQWCIDNPIIKTDYRVAAGEIVIVNIPMPQPFQKCELARFCGLAQWRNIENLKKVSEDFKQVITCIEGTIRSQKFKYAAVGMFNANIIAQDLGLKNEKDDVKAIEETTKVTLNIDA